MHSSKPTYEELEATVASLTAQVQGLAAENAELKAFGDKLNEMHNDLNGTGTGIQGGYEVACQQLGLEAAMEEFDAIETPVTDAALAEIRAQGVDAFAADLGNAYQQLRAGSPQAKALKAVVFRAASFSEQLRKEQGK
ncbi:hypothetical protein [Cedecea sp. VD19]|uniref:hypothetical protein n=1 Tax=Cedecea sp. VD19 TaxID=3081240 RepID=UPI003016C69A